MNQQNKELYRKSCKEGLRIPVFHQPAWLDVACGVDQWDVAIYLQENDVLAALPYCPTKKWGRSISLMPPLTPYLGIWLSDLINGNEKLQRKALEALQQQIPNLDFIAIRQGTNYSGSLNWIWQGWELETKYTLEIPENQPIQIDKVKGSLRNDLKKAATLCTIRQTDELSLVFPLIQNSFERSGSKMPFDYDQLEKFHQIIQQNNWGKIWIAEDADNEIIAAHYFIWDEHKVYNWISGYKKKDAIRGATQLILFEGIQWAQKENKLFDFEGGLMPGIGAMYKSFPVVEAPYLVTRKFKNKWIKALWSLRG